MLRFKHRCMTEKKNIDERGNDPWEKALPWRTTSERVSWKCGRVAGKLCLLCVLPFSQSSFEVGMRKGTLEGWWTVANLSTSSFSLKIDRHSSVDVWSVPRVSRKRWRIPLELCLSGSIANLSVTYNLNWGVWTLCMRCYKFFTRKRLHLNEMLTVLYIPVVLVWGQMKVWKSSWNLLCSHFHYLSFTPGTQIKIYVLL